MCAGSTLGLRLHGRGRNRWKRQFWLKLRRGVERRMREYLRTQRPNGPIWQTLGELMDKSSTGLDAGRRDAWRQTFPESSVEHVGQDFIWFQTTTRKMDLQYQMEG